MPRPTNYQLFNGVWRPVSLPAGPLGHQLDHTKRKELWAQGRPLPTPTAVPPSTVVPADARAEAQVELPTEKPKGVPFRQEAEVGLHQSSARAPFERIQFIAWEICTMPAGVDTPHTSRDDKYLGLTDQTSDVDQRERMIESALKSAIASAHIDWIRSRR